MKRKLVSLLMMSLVFTQLTGCSLFQKVTAEDLVIDGLNTIANAESYDMDADLVIKVKAEVEDSVTMGMDINTDINIEREEDLTHLKGDMGIEFMGMSMEEELESWVEVDGDTTYTYDYSAEDGLWYVSEEDTEDTDKAEFDEDSLDIFSDLTLEERDSKKDDYVVTALIDIDEIKDLLDEFGDTSSLDELEDLGIDTDSKDFELGFAVEMTFDADTKEIKTLKLDIDGDAVSLDEVEFEEFTLELKFNSFNEDLGLKVPKSVKNDALAAPSADDFDFGLGDEYDLGDDYEYDIMDEIEDLETDVNIDTDVKDVTDTLTTGNWVDFDDIHFYVNGTKFTLGKTTLQDMIDAGVPFEEGDLANVNNNVKANYESNSYSIMMGDYWSTTVSFGNYTDGNIAEKDAVLCYVSCYTRDDETQNVVSFDFPLDVDEETLLANAGEPTKFKTYDDDPDYVSSYYEYQKESEAYYGKYGYEFRYMNGELDAVTLDYLP